MGDFTHRNKARAAKVHALTASKTDDELVRQYHHGHYWDMRTAALGELQRRGLRPIDKNHPDYTSY